MHKVSVLGLHNCDAPKPAGNPTKNPVPTLLELTV